MTQLTAEFVLNSDNSVRKLAKLPHDADLKTLRRCAKNKFPRIKVRKFFSGDGVALFNTNWPDIRDSHVRAGSKLRVVLSTGAAFNGTRTTHENVETRVSAAEDLETIDGSMLEGGGQILRNSASLSALTRRNIEIVQVRAKRNRPGLKPQHLCGIRLVAKLANLDLAGDAVNSMRVALLPQTTSLSNQDFFEADIRSAGSICLLLQAALPVLALRRPCVPQKCSLKGGTNASHAPQIDYFINVLTPTLQRLFGLRMETEVVKRGFFPRGGGQVDVTVHPVSGPLPCFDLTERGTVQRIDGFVIAGGRINESRAMQARKAALGELRDVLRSRQRNDPIDVDVQVRIDTSSLSTGMGVVLIAKTDTGALIAGSSISGKNEDFTAVGRRAGRDMLKQLYAGGCVDEHLQDQLIIFMALAQGTSRMRCGPIELHTTTAMRIAETLTGATFEIEQDNDTSVIVCHGVGFVNPIEPPP
ncbi:MAG: hypothetical protein MHM6MM_004773 [Cercozoa sp. M6MM]